MSLLFAAPALPLHAAGKYVAGAYLVFVLLLLVYVAIMAVRLTRAEREVADLLREVRERQAAHAEPPGERRPERVA